MTSAPEKLTSSETTGLRKLGSAALSVIGPQRGEVGSVVQPTTLPSVAAAETPEGVEVALKAALPSTLSSRLHWTTTAEWERTGVTIQSIERVPDADIASGLAMVLGACRPAEPRQIVEGLAKCDAVTKAKDAHQSDAKARMAIFVEDLREFPADVVADAFKRWRRMEKFAPTVAEIRERCWRGMPLRRDLRYALTREARRRGMQIKA